MYTYKTTVKMHDTDSAGILFFGNQFKIIHDAYEAFLESIGFSFTAILKKTNFFVPIVHAEADYKIPLFVGDRITVEVTIEKIGHTSFIVNYTLRSSKDRLLGTAKTVHVSVNSKSHRKIALPVKFRQALTAATQQL